MRVDSSMRIDGSLVESSLGSRRFGDDGPLVSGLVRSLLRVPRFGHTLVWPTVRRLGVLWIPSRGIGERDSTDGNVSSIEPACSRVATAFSGRSPRCVLRHPRGWSTTSVVPRLRKGSACSCGTVGFGRSVLEVLASVAALVVTLGHTSPSLAGYDPGFALGR